MKILVTGSKGQVGWELETRGTAQGLNIIGVDIEELDIADKDAVEDLIGDVAADLVVNAAAYTAVDLAESNPEIAYQVNRDGPANLAAACLAADTPLVHISTDYVYGGDQKAAYVEDDPVAPRGVYAESKSDGDLAVAGILTKHVILRTAWVYGVHGHNFVKTMLRFGLERERLTIVNDQTGCPTAAADVAEAILQIAGNLWHTGDSPWGTYHYCGSGKTTWFGFAKEIFKIAGQYETFKVKAVEPVPTSGFPTPAKRPLNSVLDCSKITRAFDITPRPWQESLADMLQRHYAMKRRSK